MSFSQFDPQYPKPVNAGGAQIAPGGGFLVTGPLSTDEDRIRDEATITIVVRIIQTQTQTVAIGKNVFSGVGLTRWSCPVTIQSGGFQAGFAIGIATTVETYSEPDEHYTYTWSQKFKYQ
jgi:hypothetical protein